VFPSKTMHACHLVAPEVFGDRWEQFHDCFPPVTTRKWCPTKRVMSHKKVPQKKLTLGMFLYWRTPSSVWSSCQKRYVLAFLILPLLCKGRKTVGRFQVEAPRAYACKLILGLYHLPMQMANQCGLWKKLSKVKIVPANM